MHLDKTRKQSENSMKIDQEWSEREHLSPTVIHYRVIRPSHPRVAWQPVLAGFCGALAFIGFCWDGLSEFSWFFPGVFDF